MSTSFTRIIAISVYATQLFPDRVRLARVKIGIQKPSFRQFRQKRFSGGPIALENET
jgi:hypothetical protein